MSGLVFYNSKHNTFVFPVTQIFRGITTNALESSVAALALVFAEPIILSPVIQHTAPVGIDMYSVIVGPDFSGTNAVPILGPARKQ
jgi:hypothetical protein